jgi:hypothetical protein
VTRKFSAFVIDSRLGRLSHPNPEQQLRLAKLRQGLGRTHCLAFCQGCIWYIRFPKREIDVVNQRTYLHIVNDHFDALMDGRAEVDSDLVENGEQYLRAKFQATHTRAT